MKRRATQNKLARRGSSQSRSRAPEGRGGKIAADAAKAKEEAEKARAAR